MHNSNIIISRTEALILSSFIKMINLIPEEVKKLTEDALAEIDDLVESEEEKNKYLRTYIQNKFSYYTNAYIKKYIETKLGFEFSIRGSEPLLHSCACCGYKTLQKKSEYFICKVCYWEDDGTNEENKFSSVNKLTLKEARSNFITFGVINERYLNLVDKERFEQFKNN